MKREVFITSDGSTSIHLPDWDEQYHSKHGAIQEAKHVFIKMGLYKYLEKPVKQLSILEIGFGTGLNAFITYLETKKKEISVSYVGIEAYPVSENEIESLNYVSELNALAFKKDFKQIHEVAWEEKHSVSANFQLLKRKQFFEDIDDVDVFNLIYFDAFGAKNQPELWTESIFNKMYIALKKGGVLTTYSAKGSVRRAMQAVGFTVERLDGPPGKREMLRATKS
ncbi:MAG: tRNA (5-methylaminomethyl-2-thiouridine)(34)-methyltransferase MnmD [Polaribacter sp.]|uniref:tRNA (5-methylaminomethyl-2-thiouridine)(34)-methyltransferase MnmD n=1 Tax=Polaribacter sp. TaxID=1920175 RepID=UPI00321B3726